MAEDTSQALARRYQLSRATSNRQSKHGGGREVAENDEEDEDDQCDPEAWEALSNSFQDAQFVLDQNRVLIKQVNDNHRRSKAPDNLVQNVALIREINGNISKVMGIYSDLAVNFSNVVQDRRSPSTETDNCGNSTTTSNS